MTARLATIAETLRFIESQVEREFQCETDQYRSDTLDKALEDIDRAACTIENLAGSASEEAVLLRQLKASVEKVNG